MSFEDTTLHTRLYFSYNIGTRQITILTTGLNQLHLRMVQHFESLPEMANQPECPERLVRLLIQCFAVVRENIGATAINWDDKASGEVCWVNLDLHLIYEVDLPLLPTGHGITNSGDG